MLISSHMSCDMISCREISELVYSSDIYIYKYFCNTSGHMDGVEVELNSTIVA